MQKHANKLKPSVRALGHHVAAMREATVTGIDRRIVDIGQCMNMGEGKNPANRGEQVPRAHWEKRIPLSWQQSLGITS
jgi:hypothetical protein